MTRSSVLPILIVLVLSFLAAPVIADVIYLKDGRKFTGKVVSENSSEVKFKSVGGVLTFKRSEVEKIEIGLTKKDEYAARRKKIDDNDINGLLDLATWCEKERLVAQKKKIYRQLTKKVPNHPQVRRAMGQIYTDGKWVKKPKDYEEPTVRAGKRTEIKGASIALPKDWKVVVKEMTVTATGPAPYAKAPVLTVEFTEPLTPKDGFKKEVEWERPLKEVSAGSLNGLMSTIYPPDENGVAMAETLALLSGPDRGMKIKLVTYAFEKERNHAAINVVLKSLKIKAPPADYTNKTYKYCLNLPKGEGWNHTENKKHQLTIEHTVNEALDYGSLSIITSDKGEEQKEVMESVNALVAMMKETGDINEKGKITLSGVEADFVDGTFLSGGVPLRQRVAWLTHRNRIMLILFIQHEFGAKRTNEAWTILLKSFRFID